LKAAIRGAEMLDVDATVEEDVGFLILADFVTRVRNFLASWDGQE